MNEAALLAARREKNSVTEEELEEAIDRASMGLERRSRVMSEKEKIRVASHEMGHALVAHYSENLDPVHRITIIPRGTAALGLTMVRPLEDRYLATEPELKDMLAFAMGGRVAEELCFDEVSTGAQNDLERATQVARAMVAEYGMSELVGPLSLGQEDANSMFNAPEDLGAHGRGHRPGGQPPAERGARSRREDPDRTPRSAGQALRAAARHRDDRRRRTWRRTPRGRSPSPIPRRRSRTGRRTRRCTSRTRSPRTAARRLRRRRCPAASPSRTRDRGDARGPP